MTKLCFFNFFHNGDLYHSKPFIRDVIYKLGKENVLYGHNLDPMVIHDLGIQSVQISGIDNHTKFFTAYDQDLFLVNTWIGSYFDTFKGECTLNFNMKMWKMIYEHINMNFNTNLKLGPVEEYLPYIDYSAFDLQNVNVFLDRDDKKKVLFCNGPGLSGQCDYNSDMSEIITPLALQNPHITFITTKMTPIGVGNIKDTSEIIKSKRCDLNEIGYLAKYCDLIIGRNSGPFCFASTGENLNDSRKTFYAFGKNESDCFTNGLSLKSNYVFEEFRNAEQLKESITKLVDNIK